MEPRQKWIAAVGLGAIAGAALIGYAMPVIRANASTQNEIIKPANQLQTLRDQTADDLLDFEIEASDVIKGDDPIEMYGDLVATNNVIYQNPNLSTASFNAALDPEFCEGLNNFSSHPNAKLITTKDILYDHPNLAARSIGRAMVDLATQQSEAGNIDGMITTIKNVNRLTESVITFNENPAFVTYFGIQNKVSRLLFDTLRSPSITAVQIDQIDQLLQEENYSGDVIGSFTRTVRELIVATRSLEEFDQYQRLSLNTENRNTEPPSEHPKAKEAMEARLIEAWLIAKEVAEEQPDNEMAGIALDNILQEVVSDDSDGNYMVRTLGLIYEQIGRNLMRISQSRQVLRIYAYIRKSQLATGKLPDSIPDRLLQAKRDRDNVTISYTVNAESFELRADTPVSKVAKYFGHEFEINQLGGVVLTLPVHE